MKKILSLFTVFSIIILMGAGCNKQNIEDKSIELGKSTHNSGNDKIEEGGIIKSKFQDDIEVVDLNNATLVADTVSTTNMITDNLLVNIMATTTGDLYVTGTTTLQDLTVNGSAFLPTIVGTNIFTDQIFLSDGSYTDPAMVFTDDTDTGLYRVGSGEIGFTSNGTFAAIFANDQIKTNNFVARNSIPLNIFGQDASDGSGVAVRIGNATELTTAGDRIIEFYSDVVTSLKSYIDKDGNLYGNGALTVGASSSNALTLAGLKAQVTPTTLTSGGTDDFGIGISQSLNDSGAAGGSDTYRMIKGILTETDTTGWNDVYLMDLLVGASSKFNIKSNGDISMTGNTTLADTLTDGEILSNVTATSGGLGADEILYGKQTNLITNASDDASSLLFGNYYNLDKTAGGAGFNIGITFTGDDWDQSLVSLDQDLNIGSVTMSAGNANDIKLEASDAADTGDGGGISLKLGAADTQGNAGTLYIETNQGAGTGGDGGVVSNWNLGESAAYGHFAIGTNSVTDARLVVGGSTNNGTTNIIKGVDSDNASVFTLDTDGKAYFASKVRIGDTSTFGDELFHIASETDADMVLEHAKDDGDPLFIFDRARGDLTTKTIVTDGLPLGRIVGHGYDGAAYKDAAQIAFLVDGTPGIDDMPGRIELKTSPDGTTFPLTRMTIKSDGRIGIGTDSPDEIFHIQSDDDADMILEHNRVDGNPLFIFNRSGGTGAAKTIIPADDVLGGIVFSGYDGTEGSGGAYINGATIFARLDGTAGTEDMPTKLEFATTPDGTNSSVIRQTIYNDGIFEYNGLKEAKSSETVADEGTITLAVTVAGNLKVWTDGGNYLEVYVDTDGTVTQLVANGSTATTDSDTNLCVYDGGTGAVIKNRLGASKVVRYIFNYSTN